MSTKAALAALLMTSLALAGCSDDEGTAGGGAFSISAPSDPATEPFVFTAKVSAESYLWDFGDGRPKAEGKEVEHVYGITDGTVRVKLTTTDGGESVTHPAETIVIGSGENAKPDFTLEVSYDWVQVGETITLSGANSTDPEGDPLLFSWACTRESDIGPVGPSHAHGPGGIAYGAGGPDPIPSRAVNGTGLPAADRTVEGDLCANVATAGFTEDATIEGSFEQDGIYKFTMLAKDPVMPSILGSITLYVTDDPRQDPVEVIPLSGSLGTGKPSELDNLSCDDNVDQCDHQADNRFTLKYPIVSFESSLQSDANVMQELRKGCSTPTGDATADAISADGDTLEKGDHCIRTYNRQSGESAEYELTLTVQYVTDPSQLFEAPGH